MGTFCKEYASRAEVIMTACDFFSTDGKRLAHTDKAVWDTGSSTTTKHRRKDYVLLQIVINLNLIVYYLSI